MRSVEEVKKLLFELGDALSACAERHLAKHSNAIRERVLRLGTEARRYPGEYVAVSKDAILAHGTNHRAVLREAKKKEKNPLILKVPGSRQKL